MGIKCDKTASYPGWGSIGHIGVHLPQLEGQTGHLGAGHWLLILSQYLHCKLYKVKVITNNHVLHTCRKYSCSKISILKLVFFSLLDVYGKRTACLLKNNHHKIVFNWPFANKK